jgi:hypothetical protein
MPLLLTTTFDGAARVVGLGAPDVVRVLIERAQLEPLVEQLRAQRADATRRAAQTTGEQPFDERAIDDCHDELRTIEAILAQLEAPSPGPDAAQAITGATDAMHDAIAGATRRALHRAGAAATSAATTGGAACATPQLLDALAGAHAWVSTLIAFRHVDLGPNP